MSSDSDSFVRPAVFQRNVRTELSPKSRSSPPDLRRAYALARGIVRMQPDILAGRPGHHLFWVRDGAFGKITLLAHADAYVIVGRHTQCGIVLGEDPFIALRHLLVRSIGLPAGGIALRVLDLHTNLGFGLSDGSRQTSVLVEGPAALSVGEYAIIGLPADAGGDRLPDELPPPRVETPLLVREQLAALERDMSPYRANGNVSRITLMPRLVMMGEPLPPRMRRLTTGGEWTITLERGGARAMMTVSDEDLVGGVLIGRSEKCHSETLRRITDTSTSRVHVLLLREGREVVAYDLASTQGTYVERHPARRVVLSESGTLLLLGRRPRAVRMFWQRAAS